MRKVRSILSWAQSHNEQEDMHFPILGMGYGYVSMIRSQMKINNSIRPQKVSGRKQLNLIHDTNHTYLFDEYSNEKLEDQLDKIKFFSDVEFGLTMEDFIITEKDLSKIFLPIASFHDDAKNNQNDEIVAAIEGVVYPWFGLSYRLDRIQFSMEQSKIDQVDHSREAILHAQKIGNLFVDEARLSSNRYDYVF